MLLFPALWSRSRLNGLNNLNFMADRHELSEIEYQRYRTEVLDSLLSWQDEDAWTDEHLVIKDRDLESLVSDLTDSIVYRVVEDRKRETVKQWATAHNGFFGNLIRTSRRIKAKILPDYLPPRDRQDWLSIWTRALLIWFMVLYIVTLSIEGTL